MQKRGISETLKFLYMIENDREILSVESGDQEIFCKGRNPDVK